MTNVVNDPINWRIVRVPANKWCRTNDSERMSHESRIHIVPVSVAASEFMFSDSIGPHAPNVTVTSLNVSWVKVGNTFVRAYRVPAGFGRNFAMRMALRLNHQLQNHGIGSPHPEKIPDAWEE
jgi:hypothetical protein